MEALWSEVSLCVSGLGVTPELDLALFIDVECHIQEVNGLPELDFLYWKIDSIFVRLFV